MKRAAADSVSNAPIAVVRPTPSALPFPPTQAMLIGIGVAFGVPFLLGLMIWLAGHMGFTSGSHSLPIRLFAAIIEIVSLIALVTVGERRRLGSVGIWQPTL